jgi:hypothetical protein
MAKCNNVPDDGLVWPKHSVQFARRHGLSDNSTKDLSSCNENCTVYTYVRIADMIKGLSSVGADYWELTKFILVGTFSSNTNINVQVFRLSVRRTDTINTWEFFWTLINFIPLYIFTVQGLLRSVIVSLTSLECLYILLSGTNSGWSKSPASVCMHRCFRTSLPPSPPGRFWRLRC